MSRSWLLLSLAPLSAFGLLSLGCDNAEEEPVDESPSASLFEVSPPAGPAGRSMQVSINAQDSVFDFEQTQVSMGAGIDVLQVTVQDGWTLLADINIEPDAEVGPRNIQIDTSGRSYGIDKGFRVTGETFSVTPDRGKVGESVSIVLEGSNTQWKEGRTWVNLGDDVDVLDVLVISETLLEAEISIEGDASPGLRDIYTEDGPKVVTLYDGFMVDRVALAASWDPAVGTQGTQVEFTVKARDTNFLQDQTSITFYDGDGLNPDIRVDDIFVLDSENLWGRMTLSNAAELGDRDVLITTADEGLRIPDAFEVQGGTWSLDEVAVALGFNVTRGVDNETGQLVERVSAGATFFIPLDPPCPSGGSGSGSKPEPAPYDGNVVGPIIGSGTPGGAEDCPNPQTVSAGDYVWLESEANTVTLEKTVDSNSGMISYVGYDLTIDDYVPDNMYDLHLQGDPDGLAEEIIDDVQPTVPCNWYLDEPLFFGNYTQDRTTDLNYQWSNTEGGLGACTYPDAIFYTEISGTTYNGTTDPGMAASIPWDDGVHSYLASELSLLDPGPVYFIAYSIISGREFGLRNSIYQQNKADSYIYLQAAFILE